MAGHLSYGLQTPLNLIGTPTAPVTLTTAFTGNRATFITSGVAMVSVFVQYTPQTSGNAINVKIEGCPITSNDTTNFGAQVFYPETSQTVATGVVTEVPVTHTFVSSGTSAQQFKIQYPCSDQTVRISIDETVSGGTAGTGSVQILVGPND